MSRLVALAATMMMAAAYGRADTVGTNSRYLLCGNLLK
jgi:hypothetical protein